MPFLTAGGHRLEYVLLDPPAAVAGAPALVMLHEGLGSVALWKTFPASAAAVTGARVLAYSRYGYGKSDRLAAPHGVDYMHREALDVLPEVLDRLGIGDPVLVGHSDGASIALIHAGAGRWPVRGVVAMAPHVFVEDVTVRSIAQAKVAFATTDLPQRLGRFHDDVESTFRGWNDIWLHPDFLQWNIEACLAGIRCPVLLIQGEDDQYGTRAQVDAVARGVSGPVEVLMLPDCAHAPHQTNRDETLQAVAKFVAALRGPA
ncbi:MAG TPA: alpha/beta hydrolase [Burkholderiales bacterium]|nr:alpha/beta hydrolase [Burkholderiales bacterium]